MDILLMDDNPQITLLLSKILTNKGHKVTSSNSFDDGLDVLGKKNFDVLIIDVPLPGYDQLSVITELEKEKILSSYKVILFTGLEIPDATILEFKTKGLYSCLKKPLEVEKLLLELSSIPSINNTELTEKIISEEQTKKQFEDLRSNLSSLKFKLSPT